MAGAASTQAISLAVLTRGAKAPLLALGLALALGAPGCDCSGKVTEPANPVLTFEFPSDGAVLTAQDDINDDTAGVQVNVAVVVSGAEDGTVVVLSDSRNVDTSGQPTIVDGVVDDGRVTFPGYTLPAGEVSLRAVIQGVPANEDCAASPRCDEVTVQVVESICFFTSPRDGDTLTTDAYPNAADPLDAFETDVIVDCEGVGGGENVALVVRAGAGGADPGGQPIVRQAEASGRVVFARVQLGEGPNTLAIRPRTSEAGADPAGAVTTATVNVDTPRCIATLYPADGSSILAEDDGDLNSANGMQTSIDLVTDCPPSSSVALYLKAPGATTYAPLTIGTPTTLLDSVGTRFRIANVTLPESVQPYDVSLIGTVTDGARNGVSVPTDYWVDSSVPTLVSYAPGAGACVQDADTAAAGVQLNAFGSLIGAEDMSEVWVRGYSVGGTGQACVENADCGGGQRCRESLCRTVASVSAGAFQALGIPVPTGSVTLEYIGLDRAGNKSQIVLANVSVLGALPTVTIAQPADGAFLGAAADVDPMTPDLQYEVQIAGTDVANGSTGTLLISGQSPQPFVPAVGAASTTRVTVPLLDGQRTLQARLTDSCGNVVDSPAVSVTVASTPPAIVVTAYEHGGTRVVTDGGYTRSTSLDLDVFLGAGVQARDVVVERFPTFSITGTDRACTGASLGSDQVNVPASEPGVLRSDVPIAEGVTCFVISSDDGVNPVSTTLVVNRLTMAPMVSVTDPADGATLDTADDSNTTQPGFNYDVLVDLGSSPVDGTVTINVLQAGGGLLSTVSQAVIAGVTMTTFDDLSLPGGDLTLEVSYTDSLGNTSTGALVDVMVDLGPGPNVVITTPSDGQHLRTTAGAIDVSVQHVDPSPTATSCDILVDEVVRGTLNFGAPQAQFTFMGVPVTEGARALRASCTSPAGTRSSQVVRVTIDDTPPPVPQLANEPEGTPGRLVFDTGGAFVNAAVADTATAAGLQHPVSVLVATGGEDPRNWVVTLAVDTANGPDNTYQRTLTSGGNPTLVTFDNVDFGATDQTITFSVTVADRAGNTRSSAPVTLTIDRTRPVVTQTNPAPTVTELRRAHDENADPQRVDVTFRFDVTGAEGRAATFEVTPLPANKTAADFPMQATVTTGRVSFPQLAFDDGSYTAQLSVTDVAGNVTTSIYGFDVRGVAAQLVLAIPSASTTYLNSSRDTRGDVAGLQVTFAYNGAGIIPGTRVDLCSTVAPPGATTPCRWGRDGGGAPSLGGSDAGFVVGSGFLGGSIPSSAVFILDVTLAEGAQVIHAEAQEPDASPDIASSFNAFTVDSMPPVIADVAFSNSTANDSGGVVRLSPGSEGSIVNGRLRATFTITTQGLEDGRAVRVLSDRPTAATQVGVQNAASNSAAVVVDLDQGAQVLTFATSDVAGNGNAPGTDVVDSVAVVVDVAPGSASISAPQASVYTSLHGAVAAGVLTLGSGNDIVVSVSDNLDLAGGTLQLSRFTASTGGAAAGTVSRTLTTTDTSVSFAGFTLVQGLNYLEATFTDAAGNVATSSRVVYAADFVGPTLALAVHNAAGDPQSCPSLANACTADRFDPDSDTRVRLDTNASSSACPPVGACNNTGTELFFTLSSCVNSHVSLESCPITVQLESRVVDGTNPGGPTDPRPFAGVFAGSLSTSEVSTTSLNDLLIAAGGDAKFDPGITREIRLAATDSNGNASVSNSVFLTFNSQGVLVVVERLSGGATPAPTGDILEDDAYFGMAEDVSGASGFQTNFRATVTAIGVTPDEVRLSVNGGSTVTEPVGMADFLSVALTRTIDPGSPQPNVVTVEALCAGVVCGTRDYTGIIADIDPPTYQFDRCSLCALGVPLVDDQLCNACGSSSTDADAAANIRVPVSGDIATVAVWNLAGDQDSNGANGFSISSTPLVVKLNNLENGQTVSLSTDIGTLSGAAVSSNGCPGASCRATFNGLHASSVGGAQVRRISVSFTDRAGNAALPDPVRVSALRESIYARVDTVAPGAAPPLVCIGGSTTPGTVSVPSSDPTTFEDSACTGVCSATMSCDRRGGLASLRWTAPADDDASGTRVTSYDLAVAALGIPYPSAGGTVYTDCSSITAVGPFELTVPFVPTLDPGGVEQAAISGLYPHRDYCFAVIAYDDVGNPAVVSTSVSRRKVPLINAPTVVAFDGTAPNDDPAAAALYTDPTSGSAFGYRAQNLGDLDGDGSDDFGVGRIFFSGTNPTTVSLFLSATSTTSPAVVISHPTISSPNGGTFGFSFAGGDFDNDGNSDLAICAGSVTTTGAADAGANGGAVFLWWGVDGTGIRRDANTTDTQLPSPFPDVALLAPASARFCSGAGVALADVDGTAGAELIVATGSTGQVGGLIAPRVYGFSGTGVSGGARNRFPASPPATAKINLDLASAPGAGFANRANFSITRRNDGLASTFPTSLAAADVDGDGIRDLAVSDHQASHDSIGTCNLCGEVYVYKGGATLTGAVAAPNTNPTQLMHTVRVPAASKNFGHAMLRVVSPAAPAEDADWLAVFASSGTQRVFTFEGTSSGLSPATYPAGGLAIGSYQWLDNTTWTGASVSRFGFTMAFLGEFESKPGVDIVVGPGFDSAAHPVLVFSYDADSGSFVKRAVLVGDAAFGSSLAGVSGSVRGVAGHRTELIVGSQSAGSIFSFR